MSDKLADMGHAEMLSLVSYDANTGLFTRISRANGNGRLGPIKFVATPTGYLQMRIGLSRGYVHRVAWFYATGAWPSEIDHINGDKSDNRLCNLREVSRRTNAQNIRRAPSHSMSGVLGARLERRTGRYYSALRVDGRSRHLGTFDTATQAHEEYVRNKRELHDGCTL